MTTIDPTIPTDTFGQKVANGRKAIAAGVSAGFAAAVPLVGAALTDGQVNGDEAGGIAAAFAGALVTVAYVTWQTVNKARPSDVAKLEHAVGAVPPIVLEAVDPATIEYVGEPDLPVEGDADHRAPTAS